MAIRFHCPACTQPLEVDDAWASRVVACPYCRKTVTAPANSNLTDLSAVPMAMPLTQPGAAGAPPPLPEFAARSNPLAVAAIVFAGLTILLSTLMSVTASRHRLELEDIERDMKAMGPDASPMKASMEYMRTHGGQVPGWIMGLSLCFFGSLLACVTGLVCGLLALRRRARRALAWTSVLVCGGLTVWVGLGIFLSAG
jgi:hypothetical protein